VLEEKPREEKGISNRRIYTIFIPPLTCLVGQSCSEFLA